MSPHVCPHERAYRNDAHALGTARLKRSFYKSVTDMPAAKTIRNFCVNESQCVGRPLVREERCQPIHRDFEPLQLGIVRYSHTFLSVNRRASSPPSVVSSNVHP